MTDEKPRMDITDLTRQTQAFFSSNGATVPQFEQVMKAQKNVLEQVEAFNRRWLARRQEAFDTALQAMTKMQSTDKPDPAAAMQAIADWQRGSVERVTADLQEWMTLCMQVGQVTTAAPDDAAQNDAAASDGTDGKATGAKGRSAASSKKSEHATPV